MCVDLCSPSSYLAHRSTPAGSSGTELWRTAGNVCTRPTWCNWTLSVSEHGLGRPTCKFWVFFGWVCLTHQSFVEVFELRFWWTKNFFCTHFLCLCLPPSSNFDWRWPFSNLKTTIHNFPARRDNLSRCSDSLRAGRSGDRMPVGARFSSPVQTDTGAHPASCTMGTGSFPGVKRPGRGVDHPPPYSAEVKGRVELYLSTTSWAS